MKRISKKIILLNLSYNTTEDSGSEEKEKPIYLRFFSFVGLCSATSTIRMILNDVKKWKKEMKKIEAKFRKTMG